MTPLPPWVRASFQWGLELNFLEISSWQAVQVSEPTKSAAVGFDATSACGLSVAASTLRGKSQNRQQAAKGHTREQSLQEGSPTQRSLQFP